MNGIRRQFTGFLNKVDQSNDGQLMFALIIHVPVEMSQALDDIRRRYDPAFKVAIPAHITLKRPTSLADLAQLPVIRAYLRRALLQFPPLPVQITGYGLFRSPGRNVVFLKIADETALRQLHKIILETLATIYPTNLADQYEGEAYHPHLTVGNELSDLDLAVLEHELSNGSYQLNYSFLLEEVTLSVGQLNKSWSSVEVFSLAGAPLAQTQE